jgi:hypothetical protein
MKQDLGETSIWNLKQGNTLLAMLEENDQDFPWVYCRLIAQPEFEPYRNLFTRLDYQWRGREKELHQLIADAHISLETIESKRVRSFTLVLTEEGARLTFTEV